MIEQRHLDLILHIGTGKMVQAYSWLRSQCSFVEIRDSADTDCRVVDIRSFYRLETGSDLCRAVFNPKVRTPA